MGEGGNRRRENKHAESGVHYVGPGENREPLPEPGGRASELAGQDLGNDQLC